MAEPVTFTMPSDCTLRTAQALRTDLLAALEGAAGLVLDCAAIEAVDVTFVQIVVAAAKAAAARGAPLDLTNLPDAAAAAFRRAGLAPHAPFAAAVPAL
ncbi:STAS domain-containing protein [Methylobacterium sp. J-001]|uniref:STAS domain-containing protein n=1 Tax=Methylobacterium sp. J-001 TaxID=2836609 RepID=UPI001FBB224D|nr:STAS domain-containing protein [Methylobacterium sp. J-001]MCJ2117922.1 STAS domain-containing protein [Methylobacterium sp. J-001]